MKAREVRKLLGCSYTTLHNYVKTGKLQLVQHAGKQQEYDEASVMRLYNTSKKYREHAQNHIHIFTKNKKYVFQLTEMSIKRILDSLQAEIAAEIKDMNGEKHETSRDNSEHLSTYN